MYMLSDFNEDFRSLIIGESIKTDLKQDIVRTRSMVNDGDNINLPKKEIFHVFRNVHELGLNLQLGPHLYPIS